MIRDNSYEVTLRIDDIGSTIHSAVASNGDSATLSITDTQVITTDDHSQLSNRDLPEQHPISAISDLSEELDERVEITSTIPDSDIIALL